MSPYTDSTARWLLCLQEGQLAQFSMSYLFSRVDPLSAIRSKVASSYFITDINTTRLWYRPEPTVTWRPLRDLTLTLDQEKVMMLVNVAE